MWRLVINRHSLCQKNMINMHPHQSFLPWVGIFLRPLLPLNPARRVALELEGRFWVLVAFFIGLCVVIFVKAYGVDKLSRMSESIILASPEFWLELKKEKEISACNLCGVISKIDDPLSSQIPYFTHFLSSFSPDLQHKTLYIYCIMKHINPNSNLLQNM